MNGPGATLPMGSGTATGNGNGGMSMPGGIPANVLNYLSSVTTLANSLSRNVLPGSLMKNAQADQARSQATALWKSAQSWPDFFDTKKINKPTSTGELRERLADNLSHFSSNYMLCFMCVAVLSVLLHPLSFLCVVMLAILYVYMFVQHPDAVMIGPARLVGNTKVAAFGTVSLFSLYITNAIGVIGSWAVFAIILSLMHAGFRASAKEPDFDSPVASV